MKLFFLMTILFLRIGLLYGKTSEPRFIEGGNIHTIGISYIAIAGNVKASHLNSTVRLTTDVTWASNWFVVTNPTPHPR